VSLAVDTRHRSATRTCLCWITPRFPTLTNDTHALGNKFGLYYLFDDVGVGMFGMTGGNTKLDLNL